MFYEEKLSEKLLNITTVVTRHAYDMVTDIGQNEVTTFNYVQAWLGLGRRLTLSCVTPWPPRRTHNCVITLIRLYG